MSKKEIITASLTFLFGMASLEKWYGVRDTTVEETFLHRGIEIHLMREDVRFGPDQFYVGKTEGFFGSYLFFEENKYWGGYFHTDDDRRIVVDKYGYKVIELK